MSDYLKVALGIKAAEDSEYTLPFFNTASWDPFVLTPDECTKLRVEASTGGDTVTTSGYNSVTLLAIWNTSTTSGNYVTATFRSAGNGSTSNILRINPGHVLLVTDFTAANNLTLAAASTAAICEVIIAGT